MKKCISKWLVVGGMVLFGASLVTAQSHDAHDGKVKEHVDKAMQEFLEKNKDGGYTSEKNEKGFTVIKDKEGNVVPLNKILPPPDQKHGAGGTDGENQGKQPPHLTKENVEKAIKDFLEKHKDHGYTSSTDDKGRTIVKDKDGHEVPLHEILPPPSEGQGAEGKGKHPQHPPKEVVEKAIKDFLEKHKDQGYTSSTDDHGRTIVKDKDGKEVPLHKILPPPPHHGADAGSTASSTESTETATASATTDTTTSSTEETTSQGTIVDPSNPDNAMK